MIVASASWGRLTISEATLVGLNAGVFEIRSVRPTWIGQLAARHHDERQEVVVPVGHEVEEADERDHRGREGHGDRPEDRELAGAVDACGIQQIV